MQVTRLLGEWLAVQSTPPVEAVVKPPPGVLDGSCSVKTFLDFINSPDLHNVSVTDHIQIMHVFRQYSRSLPSSDEK